MILATGITGFIGKHLLKSLIDKYGKENIVALTSAPIVDCKYLLHNNYNFEANYFADSGFSHINTILHAGAFAPKNNSTANNIELCTSNILNTQKLLSANLPEFKKFIFLSTLDVYDDDKIITEESIVNPVSLYGSSKLYCEKMIEAWAKNNGKICQILRIGHVYGNGEEKYQKIIPITINKILSGQNIELWGEGTDLRTFIHVDDVVNAIIKSVELENYIYPINVVGDKSISIYELIQKLIILSKKKCEITKKETTTVTRNLIFDNSKLKKYLLSPQKTFDEGLLEEIKYMETLL